MAIRLPLADNVATPHFSFRMTLEGEVFRLDFDFNERDQRYYLSVSDENEDPIARSVKVLRTRSGLLSHVTDARRPKGEFVVIDRGAEEEPTLGNLGVGIDVLFVSYAEALA